MHKGQGQWPLRALESDGFITFINGSLHVVE